MTKKDMLAEIIKFYGLERNSTFAEFFGISPQLAISRKKMGIMDYEDVYRRCREISPDWLLSGGEGPMLRADRGEQIVVVEPPKDSLLAGAVNDSLKRIGQVYNPHTKKWEGDALFPDISYYWARHTWGTLAAELDVPERTIGAALGHSTSKSVTSVYIRVDMRKKNQGGYEEEDRRGQPQSD